MAIFQQQTPKTNKQELPQNSTTYRLFLIFLLFRIHLRTNITICIHFVRDFILHTNTCFFVNKEAVSSVDLQYIGLLNKGIEEINMKRTKILPVQQLH